MIDVLAVDVVCAFVPSPQIEHASSPGFALKVFAAQGSQNPDDLKYPATHTHGEEPPVEVSDAPQSVHSSRSAVAFVLPAEHREHSFTPP